MRALLATTFAMALMGAAASPATATVTPSALYVFGDSLVDAGNVDVAFGNSFNPPAQGYFPGRFTNGPDYTDLLNQQFFGGYTTPSLLGGNNYAFGGSRAVDLGVLPPALDLQVGAFLTDHAGKADPNALYIVNTGGNDVFGLETADIGGYTPNAYAAAVVSSITDAVATLNAAGARRILVAGIPVVDPVGTPLDALLQGGLDALEPSLLGHLYRLDYQDLLPAAVGDPAAFGLPPFTNISDACNVNEPVVNGTVDCTGYLFFDDTHPTAAVQAAIFAEVDQILAVPEPASWALMILGLGGLGARLRSVRRRHLAAA